MRSITIPFSSNPDRVVPYGLKVYMTSRRPLGNRENYYPVATELETIGHIMQTPTPTAWSTDKWGGGGWCQAGGVVGGV